MLLPFSLVELLRIYLIKSFLEFLTQFVQKRPSTPWFVQSEVFTFDHLFVHRSDVFNNLSISMTEWPEDRK